MYRVLLLASLLCGLVVSQKDALFWQGYSMRIKNVGEYYATNGFVECSTRGFRWLPIVDEESNRKVTKYLRDNDITEAWIGLLQTLSGQFQWMAQTSGHDYTNWAEGQPQIGYVYIEASTGKWKTVRSRETKTTLCVEMRQSCELNGKNYADGAVVKDGCKKCKCANGNMDCSNEGCEKAAAKTEGCVYKDSVIDEGEAVDIGCSRCTCKKKLKRSGKYSYKLACTSCSLIDISSGTPDETQYRAQNQCPPVYAAKGHRWVSCDEEGASGCTKTCDGSYSQCRRNCIDRCMCPPEAPFLNHGSCTKACPGRRYAPAIIQGFSNRNVPEGQEFEVSCTAVGEPEPQIAIYEGMFEPDLTQANTFGQLGLRTASKTFMAKRGYTPDSITCYAWNVNGISKSTATFKVIQKSGVENPTIGPDGNLRMPPMVRLGIENLAVGARYGQKMRCVVTGAPRPEVIIVKLQGGSNVFPPVHSDAESGVHNVEIENIVLVNSVNDTGRYACLASNKYGAIKDIATLSFVEEPPTPGDVNMAIGTGWRKQRQEIKKWPFEAGTGCQYKEQSYKEGQSWKVECNTCTCQNNEVACSKKICGDETCKVSGGRVYSLYDRWQEECNTCTCMKNGHSFCTKKDCGAKTCPYKGRSIELGATFNVECNTCVCLSTGTMFCSKKDCSSYSEPEPTKGSPIESTDNVTVPDEEEVKPSVRCGWFGGKTFNAGETFKHGCKPCRCVDVGGLGRVTCDECPSNEGRQKFCTWRGARMIEGMRFKDDCKICSCKEGEIACEGKSCADKKKEAACLYKGVEYGLMDKFKDDCNVCMCLGRGGVSCSQNNCNLFKVLDPCMFQGRSVKHGTQLQVECNVCKCNNGAMQCTDDDCGFSRKIGALREKDGCSQEGESRVYSPGSMIQGHMSMCKCEKNRRGKFEFNCSY